LQQLRAWASRVRWLVRVTILLQLTKVWVAQVNPIHVQADLVQLEPVVHLARVVLLVRLVLVEALVQVDLLLVQLVHLVELQVELRVARQVSVLRAVVQELVAAVAVAAQRVLLVKVVRVTHLRLESRRG
jgi:hypothetical protein